MHIFTWYLSSFLSFNIILANLDLSNEIYKSHLTNSVNIFIHIMHEKTDGWVPIHIFCSCTSALEKDIIEE